MNQTLKSEKTRIDSEQVTRSDKSSQNGSNETRPNARGADKLIEDSLVKNPDVKLVI